MKNAVIYTCITGDYDCLMEPGAADPDFDYVCFVEKGMKTAGRSGIWEIRETDFSLDDKTVLSRYPKINPHILLPEYEYSVWIDGNIVISDMYFYDIVRQKIRSGVLYSGMKHWARDCAYDEVAKCIDARVDSRIRLIKALAFLKKNHFPKHYGMYENNVIFRCHNAPEIMEFDTLWWQMFTDYTHRDQILHPYCMMKCGIRTMLPTGNCTGTGTYSTRRPISSSSCSYDDSGNCKQVCIALGLLRYLAWRPFIRFTPRQLQTSLHCSRLLRIFAFLL